MQKYIIRAGFPFVVKLNANGMRLLSLLAGDESAEVTEEEVNVVRMKTRQMVREEISQSMVTRQQGIKMPKLVQSFWAFSVPLLS